MGRNSALRQDRRHVIGGSFRGWNSVVPLPDLAVRRPRDRRDVLPPYVDRLHRHLSHRAPLEKSDLAAEVISPSYLRPADWDLS